jgi:heptaprenyl diphosphate synthase
MAEDLEKVSAVIRASSASRNPVISEGLSSLFDGRGKMLRPALFLISSAFGKADDRRYNLAACIEMLHIATLIHDDVIDDSPLRRGVAALHTRFGKRSAVLIGDYLLSRCFLLAAEHGSPENALGMAKAASLICGMEIEQNGGRFSADFSMRRYLRNIIGKSATLFSLACHAGAAESKAPKSIIGILRRTGYNIGMAFQIIDDILDYSGNPETTGKPPGSDIRGGLVTLPLICAMSGNAAGTLGRLFNGGSFSPGDCGDIIRLVREAGGLEAARAHAGTYTSRALREIAGLPSCPHRAMLETLTRRLLLRDA